MTYTEPEWTEEDVVALAAVTELRRSLGPHGHPMNEAVDPAGDPSNPNRTIVWEVPNPTIDFAAQALAKKKRAYMQRYGEDVDIESLRWRVHKREL